MSFFNLPFGVRIAGDQPVDGDRYIATDLTTRDSLIGSGREFDGLQVYVESEQKLFILIDKTAPLWEEVGGGSIPVQYWVVDPINGDDGTGEFGSTTKPFATIAGAEAGATAGDYIKIVSDIEECGLGKNGITYIFDKGVKLFYRESSPTPGSLNSGHLWNDYNKGQISFRVFGGIHESDGDWFGNFDRGIIHNNNASDIRMYVEEITAKGNDSDWCIARGDGGTIEMHSQGEIFTPLNGVVINTATNYRIVLTASGKIECSLRGIASYGTSGGNEVIVNSQTEFRYTGHPIGGLRSCLYGSLSSVQDKDYWTITAPVVSYIEDYPNIGSTNGGFIFSWSNWHVHMTINADLFYIKNTDPITYPNAAGIFALNRTGSGAKMFIDWNVKVTLLGKSHNFMDAFSAIDRDNCVLKFTNSTLVFLTDVVESKNGLYTNETQIEIEGTLKIILTASAILAGQTAIGDSGANTATILGRIVTNGDFFDVNFTDDFTGLVGPAITNIKVNDTSHLTDITYYDDII